MNFGQRRRRVAGPKKFAASNWRRRRRGRCAALVSAGKNSPNKRYQLDTDTISSVPEKSFLPAVMRLYSTVQAKRYGPTLPIAGDSRPTF